MYNSLNALPNIPYNIMVYLAQSSEAENLWKLLAYNSYDALSKDNLTFEQKLDLIWKTGKQEDYSVFLTNLVEDAIPVSKTIVKIYHYYTHAEALYNGVSVFAFDCLYGGQMSLVEYNGVPVSRGDLFIHIVLSVLNGANVQGIGKLTFYDDMSRYDLAQTVVGNQKTFTGVQLFMSTMVGDSGVEDSCGS